MTDVAPVTGTEPGSHVDTVLSSSTLLMGTTGSGKTSLLVTLIEFVWETWRKVSLLYITDGGGIPPQLQALVLRGIVRIWKMRTRSARGLSFETCQRAAQGWWPVKINPRTGETEPNVKLIPSTIEELSVACAQGHFVRKVITLGQMGPQTNCPTCQTIVTQQNMKVERTSRRTPGFEQIGAIFYDGASSMCSWMMDDLGERAGRNELGGEKGALGTIVSGDWAGGSNNRAAYGFVQTRIEAMVLSSNGIPNLVMPPVWTALTHEISDEGGLPLRGPMLVGQAKTAVAGQWFGDTLEAMVVEHDGKRFRRLCLSQFVDEKGIRHLCQVRSFPGTLPSYLEDEESDDPNLAFRTFSLAHFYRLREAAKRQSLARYDEKYTDAPGLPVGDMEYGVGLSDVPTTGGAAAASAAVSPAGPTLSPAALARQRAAGAQGKASTTPVATATAGTPVEAADTPSKTPVASPAPPAGTTPPAEPAPNTAIAPADPGTGPVGTTSTTPVAHPSPEPVQPAAQTAQAPAPAAPPVGARQGLSPAERARQRLTKPAGAVAPPPPVPAPSPAPAPSPTPAASPMATGPAAAPPPPPVPPARGPVAPPPGRRPSA